MGLTPFICTQCGGQVDRATLTCHNCYTQFYLNEQQVLIATEHLPNERTIGATVCMRPEELMYCGDKIIEYSVKELTHKLAEGLAPFMEIEQDADPMRNLIMLHARCRVLEPHGSTVMSRYDLRPSLAPKNLTKKIEEAMSKE